MPFKGSAVYSYETQFPLITRHRHNASQYGKTALDASFAVIKNSAKIDANHLKTNITTPGTKHKIYFKHKKQGFHYKFKKKQKKVALFSVLKNAFANRKDYRFFLLQDCRRSEWPDIDDKLNLFLKDIPIEHVSEIQFGGNKLMMYHFFFSHKFCFLVTTLKQTVKANIKHMCNHKANIKCTNSQKKTFQKQGCGNVAMLVVVLLKTFQSLKTFKSSPKCQAQYLDLTWKSVGKKNFCIQ